MVGSNLAKKPIIIEATRQEEIKLRVAAYCRVSTDSEDQMNSFVAQNTHYNTYIRSHDNWTLVDVYADEGISGTSAKKRGDFQRLLEDCRKGKIDKVLVKSISRFARNTAECLEAIRELKSLGISVFFEEHNIDTKMVSSEMLTAVIASCAQAESESISKNMRWSYQKRMERGQFITCKAPYGYALEKGTLVMLEDEAKVIRQIFTMYLNGESTRAIAREMTELGITPPESAKQWSFMSVGYILQNEKYIGDSLAQKTFATDTFPTRKMKNNGEKVQYYVQATHPPIIAEEAYRAAQVLLKSKRNNLAGTSRTTYDFTQKIVCGECGTFYQRKVCREKTYWICRNQNNGQGCMQSQIPEKEFYEAFLRLYFKLKHHGDQIFQTIIHYSAKIRRGRMLWNEEIVELNKQIADISAQIHTLAQLNQKGFIHPDMYISKSNRLAEQLRAAKQKKEKLLGQEDDDLIVKTRWIMEALEQGPDFLDAFDGELFCELVERIIVESNTKIRFRLKNGMELPENIERTVR